jgi:hypothetical protein
MESHKIQSGVTPGSIIKVDEAGDAPRGWIHEQMFGTQIVVQEAKRTLVVGRRCLDRF